MHVALYARVSTNDQAPETQIVALREYCVATRVGIHSEYVDAGVTGSTASRPELDRLMRDVTARKVKAVLVWKFDRLFRSVPHMLEALETFRHYGVEFVSITEAIDTTTPMGRMVYTLLAAVAEFEKGLIRERTLAGMARARAQGKRIGRPRVEVNVERAAQLWAGGKGWSLRQIAEALKCGRTTIERALATTVPKANPTLLGRQQAALAGDRRQK